MNVPVSSLVLWSFKVRLRVQLQINFDKIIGLFKNKQHAVLFPPCILSFQLISFIKLSAANEEQKMESIQAGKLQKLKKFQHDVRERVKALEKVKQLQQLDKSYEAVSTS